MTPEFKVESHDYNVHVLILILVPNTWTLNIMGNGKSPKTNFFFSQPSISLGAIETLICHREMSLKGSTSFGFAQDTINDFRNKVLNSKWHCFRKRKLTTETFFHFLQFFS